MGHIFISYSRKDENYVNKLVEALENEGFEVWIDRELLTGDTWIQVINHKIDTCDAFVIVMTDDSKESNWVRREVLYAIQEGKRIYPLLLQGKLWMYLQDFNFFKVTEGSIPDKKFFRDIEKTVPRSEAWLADQREIAEKDAREKAHLKAEEVERLRLTQAKAEREAAEKADQKRKEKELREKQAREARDKEKHVTEKKEEKPAIIKPKANGRSVYWVGGFVTFVFGGIAIALIVILASLINPPQPPEPTPENTQQVISTLTDIETITPSQTLNPVITLTPTSLSTEIIDKFGVEIVFIPAGEFVMGNDSGSDDERPAHTVYLDEYYIDKYEVTNALYKTCVKEGVCDLPNNLSSSTRSDYYENPKYNNYPVVYINWTQAKTYCEWRGAYLPTEAQWEKAARGKDERNYPWGEGVTCADANLCEDDTSEVGIYKKNISSYGVYDMVGNVFEMTADWYGIRYYPVSPVTNPTGPSIGDRYVVRGGSYDLGEANLGFARLTMRWSSTTTDATVYNGFRCAKDANPKE